MRVVCGVFGNAHVSSLVQLFQRQYNVANTMIQGRRRDQ